jgi:hypothetical protein
MNSFDPIGDVKSGHLSLNSAWLLPFVILVVLVVGYLCFDAWRDYRKKKQFDKRRQRAKKAYQETHS